MDASRPAYPTYLPARVPLVGTREHSARKLSLAMVDTPDHICGQALRVGYTGTKETDFALYRLKIKSSPELPAITLSGFFVLENGLFRVYE